MIMYRTSINYGLMLKAGWKVCRCFNGDGWWCNRGPDYLVVVHILWSIMLILNDHVVQNDTYMHDHTKHLVGKIMIWVSELWKWALRIPKILFLSPSVCPPGMHHTSADLESMGGGWSSQTSNTEGRCHRQDIVPLIVSCLLTVKFMFGASTLNTSTNNSDWLGMLTLLFGPSTP